MDKVIVFWKKAQTFHPDFINPKIGWENAFWNMIPKNSFIKVKTFKSYKPDPSEIHYIPVWIPNHNVILEEKYFSHFKQTLKEIDEIAPECRVLLNTWDEHVVNEDRFIIPGRKHHTDPLWNILRPYIKKHNYYLLQNGITKLKSKKVLSIDSFKLLLTGENEQAKDFKRTSDNLNANKKYKMSCVFGRPRMDRVSMAAKLLEANILHNKDFYYTLFDTDVPFNKEAGYHDIKTHLEINNWIMGTQGTKIMGMRVNEKFINEIKFGQWCNDGSEWQVPPCIPESLFTILFETHEHQYAFTEKMFKPIVSKVPFIWYSGKNTLERFEALGYKRHRFVNYYFDKLEPEIRLKALYKEICRLYHLPNLKELISNDQDILDHNYNNFWSTLDNDTERFYTTFRV